MPIGVPAAMLIGSAIAGGTQVAGGIMSNRANNRAARLSQQGTDAQLSFMREQAAQDQRNYEQQQQQARAQWDAEQQRRAPYRAASASILSKAMGGMPVQPYQPTYQPQGSLSALIRR